LALLIAVCTQGSTLGSSSGQKGQGPNDFIFPIGNTIQVTNEGFIILDMNIIKFVEPQPDDYFLFCIHAYHFL